MTGARKVLKNLSFFILALSVIIKYDIIAMELDGVLA